MFVPTTSGFDDDVLDKTKNDERWYKLEIDEDDNGSYTDYSSYIYKNSMSGSGKRSGSHDEAVSNEWNVVLDNKTLGLNAGDWAQMPVKIWAKAGSGNSYIQIFTGWIDRRGAKRTIGNVTKDTISFHMVDGLARRGVRRKPSPALLLNFKISDPASPSTSLMHRLAEEMGEVMGNVDFPEIDHTKNVISLDGETTALEDLHSLAAQFLALVRYRYDGKLIALSQYQTGYVDPSSEWTFSEALGNLCGEVTVSPLPIQANDVTTEFPKYTTYSQMVIYKYMEGIDVDTEEIAIEVAAGEYWPGETSATDKAVLEYYLFLTNEKFDFGTSIQTPTIGLTGSGSDIECDGGLLTLTSFNGSTGATRQNADSAEIILHNATGSLITITKLEIRGQGIMLTEQHKIHDQVSGLSDWEIDPKEVPGKFCVSVDQGDYTVKWKLDYWSVPRRIFTFETVWTPQIQEGAVATLVLPGETITGWVDEYTHPPANGPVSKYRTTVKLIEKESISVIPGPEVAYNIVPAAGAGVPASLVIQNAIDTRPTYTEVQEGYTSGGGTKTPTVPEIEFCQGEFMAIVLRWDRQLNLTNFSHYELQVSDDPFQVTGDTVDTDATVTDADTSSIGVGDTVQGSGIPDGTTVASITSGTEFELSAAATATAGDVVLTIIPAAPAWYSLEFDGSDWKDVLAGVTEWPTEFLVHPDLPLGGTAEDPLGVSLYYRVRRETKDTTTSSWSDVVGSTTKAVESGALAENSIYANNIIAAQALIMLLRSTALWVGYDGTGDYTSPDEGDRRIYQDADEILFQTYTAGAWSTYDSIKLGGVDSDGNFFPFLGCRGLYSPVASADDLADLEEVFPGVDYLLFNMENSQLAHNGLDPWFSVQNDAYNSSIYKYGSYSLFATSGNQGVLATNTTYWTIGESQSCGAWVYLDTIDATYHADPISYFRSGDQINVEIYSNKVDFVVYRATTKTTLTVTISLSTSAWHYFAICYDGDEDILYGVIDNTIYSEDTLLGTWTSSVQGALYIRSYNNYTSTRTLYIDEVVFAPDLFIDPDIFVQHYLHDRPWSTKASAQDVVAMPAAGGRFAWFKPGAGYNPVAGEPSWGTPHRIARTELVSEDPGAETNDLDLSSIVPEGTRGVWGFMRAEASSVADGRYLRIQEKDSGTTVGTVQPQVNNLICYSTYTVVLNADRVFKWNSSSNYLTLVTIWLLGYWL